MSHILIVLACLCGSASADLGDPTVQAVCRIKLTNGRVIEGFITVAAGGYEGTHPSGFRFEAGANQATHFLNVDFKKLTRDPLGTYRVVFNGGRGVSETALRKPSRIVFLDWQVETINDQEHQQYKDLDALTIVTELPYHLYIAEKYEGLQRGSIFTIPLKRIVSFELIEHPSKKWLDHIKERRQVSSEVDADAEDFTEPDWYHELRRHQEFVPVEYSPPKYQSQDVSALIRQLTDQTHGSFLRIKTARALRDLGARAKPAIPALIEALNDREYAVGFFAAKALVKLKQAAVAGLAEALKNQSEKARTEAGRLLGEIGPRAEGAIPILSSALRGEDEGATFEAAQALSRIGSSAIPVLIEALKDHHDYVRRNAAGALGKPNATVAIPALVKSLNDSDASVREAVAQALGNIGQPAIPALSDALSDQEKTVRGGALSALAMIRPLEPAVVPLLIEALKDPDKSVRIGALTLIARLGTEAKSTMDAVVEASRDQNADVRSASARALGAIGPDPIIAVPALIKALNDENEKVRWQASSALRMMGPVAKEAVPALIEALQDKNEQVRFDAGWTLRVVEHQLATVLDQISRTQTQTPEMIEQIKAMKPEIHGQPSVLTLDQAVKEESRKKGADGLIPIGWEASQKTDGRWEVVLHYRDDRAQYLKAEWEYDPDSNRIYPFELQNAPGFWVANSFWREATSRTGILIIVCSSLALGCVLIIAFRKSLRRLLSHGRNHQV